MLASYFIRGARVLVALWMCLGAGAAAAASSPELSLMGLRDALVQNDLRTLVTQALPPSELARERAEVAERRQRSVDPQVQVFQREQFDASFGRLISPDAVNVIMAELEPGLREMRAPMLAGQLLFFAEASKSLHSEPDYTAQQKTELQALLNAVQLYLARTDVLDGVRLSKALQELVLAARATGIVSLEQMEQLDYDEALVRFSVFLSAGKRALGHYDLDANAVLRSARFRTLQQTQDSAEVEIEARVLDVTLHLPVTLYAREGGWYLFPAPAIEAEVDDPVQPGAEAAVAVAPDAVVAAPEHLSESSPPE